MPVPPGSPRYGHTINDTWMGSDGGGGVGLQGYGNQLSPTQLEMPHETISWTYIIDLYCGPILCSPS